MPALCGRTWAGPGHLPDRGAEFRRPECWALDNTAAPDKTISMTPAFARFVEPARRRPQLWRLVLGIMVAVAIYLLWTVSVIAGAWFLLGADEDPMLWTQSLAEADTAEGTLVLLLTFVGMALGPMAAARWLHGRRAGTLFGPRVRTLRDFVVAAGVVFAVLGIALGLWTLEYDAVVNLPVSTWAMVLPLTLLGLLVQTGAEEVLFRGYMQSQLAARFRSPLVWLVIPSLLFGIVHFDAMTAGANVWLVVGSASVFGLIAADLTARTGSIGAAWGFHFANNVMAIAILSTGGTITGLARWVTPYTLAEYDASAPAMLFDVAMLVFAWWLVRRAVAR
jgi:membrane protease YdiL (CAAX protease family)